MISFVMVAIHRLPSKKKGGSKKGGSKDNAGYGGGKGGKGGGGGKGKGRKGNRKRGKGGRKGRYQTLTFSDEEEFGRCRYGGGDEHARLLCPATC